MATHRELVTQLRNHAETSADLRALLEPFERDQPAAAPPADQPHAHASQAGSSACSVCQNEADHRLHRPPRVRNAGGPPADPPPAPPGA